MKKALVLAALACLVAAPSFATDFSIYGSYWDTDAAGDTGGGGVRLGIPLGRVLDLDIRATYYEEVKDRPFDALGDVETPFVENGIQILPVDLGLRADFAPESRVNPYVGGGASYFFLDSDFGDVDDEAGWYALGGLEIGSFFVEAAYRGAEATVENDPDDFDDFDDIDFEEETAVELDGFAANAGFVWRF